MTYPDWASVFWGALGGIGVWLATDFFVRPLAKARGLVEEVRITTGMYANLPARFQESDDGMPEPVAIRDLTGKEQMRLERAHDEIRLLGVKLQALATTQPLVNRVYLLFGRDLFKAGSGLIGISNTLEYYGSTKHFHKRTIATALKWPDI